jgi:DNA-directed RNA polymerase specialized sigma24 family protein
MNCHFQRTGEDAAKRVDYAMPSDFCQMFDDHLDRFYTLALLLTADHHKAEQCLVAGLEDSLQGNPVFREWAQSWAKRAVIKNAIRIISPLRRETGTATRPHEPMEPPSEADTPVAAIIRLQPFDRLVYVLSVLEKYSDRECSMLLACTVGEVAAARVRAVQRLANVGGRIGPPETALPRAAGELKQVYGEVS